MNLEDNLTLDDQLEVFHNIENENGNISDKLSLNVLLEKIRLIKGFIKK